MATPKSSLALCVAADGEDDANCVGSCRHDVDEGEGVAISIDGYGVTVMAPVSDTSVGMASFV
jgi:hypothetical protein